MSPIADQIKCTKRKLPAITVEKTEMFVYMVRRFLYRSALNSKYALRSVFKSKSLIKTVSETKGS